MILLHCYVVCKYDESCKYYYPLLKPTVSAGVGRTGCWIALDTLIQHVEEHDFIDVFGLVSEMRQHRNHMIQTEVRYNCERANIVV